MGDEVRARVEVGGMLASRQGINLPNVTVSLPAVSGEDLELIDAGVEMGVDFIALSFIRRREDLEPVRRHLGRPPRPVDREDREAGRGRERRRDHRGGRRGDGGARRPRDRAPDRAGAARPEADPPDRGQAADAVDHRHPDARVDGAVDAPDARRGGGRRERDLRRHRRGDALAGDRRRPLPGRGGGDDGLDRDRDRARAALRPVHDRAGGRGAATRRPRSPSARSAPPTSSGSRRSSCRR